MATIVMIHGAFQGGWIFNPVADYLRSCGHRVLAPSLDGCGERTRSLRPGITSVTQGAEIADLMFHEDLSDVILVATSTGGVVACAAAEHARDRIGKLVFADAMVLMDNETPCVEVPPAPSIDTDVSTIFQPQFLEGYYAELGPELSRWILARTTPHPIGALNTPVRLPTFWKQDWNAVVIRCTQALKPPLEYHQRATQRLNARYYELDTGHFPMLTAPEALGRLILEG